MFTGIIQAVGKIRSIERRGASALAWIDTPWALADVLLGESIAVNGCCLTVTGKRDAAFSADLSDETLRLTTFVKARAGTAVNLERALQLSDRLGGHIVTGHVDGIGQIVAVKPTSGSIEISVRLPQSLMKYVVHKGSIAIDGISLTATLSHSQSDICRVYIIPHTESKTTLAQCRVGDEVNLEVDHLAKMVERLVSGKFS